MEVEVVADICPIEIDMLGGSVTVATLLVGLGCCGVTGVSADKSNLKENSVLLTLSSLILILKIKLFFNKNYFKN